MWSVVETCIAIVSACLPTMQSLFRQPANRASARERYQASYTLKNINNSGTSKVSTLKSPWLQDTSLRRQEAEEERAFSRSSDGR